MYWTLELASKLEDAPWPATKDELIDYAMRSGAPLEVIENKMRARFMKALKIFGPIIPAKKISFSTRMSIKPRIVPTHNAYFFKATEVGTKILTSFIFSSLQ